MSPRRRPPPVRDPSPERPKQRRPRGYRSRRSLSVERLDTAQRYSPQPVQEYEPQPAPKPEPTGQLSITLLRCTACMLQICNSIQCDSLVFIEHCLASQAQYRWMCPCLLAFRPLSLYPEGLAAKPLIKHTLCISYRVLSLARVRCSM